MTASLDGLRVLVVEDEFLVASVIQQMLESAGCAVVGPVARVGDAVAAAETQPCDAAVLDVNLAGERVDPVADALSRRNVPFAFVTGYIRAGLPRAHAMRPRLCKPFRMADLIDTVSRLVAAPAKRVAPA